METNHDDVPGADDLLPEYDLKSLKVLSRGKYAAGYAKARRFVCLDPEVVEAFPDEASINAVLKEYLQSHKPQPAAAE